MAAAAKNVGFGSKFCNLQPNHQQHMMYHCLYHEKRTPIHPQIEYLDFQSHLSYLVVYFFIILLCILQICLPVFHSLSIHYTLSHWFYSLVSMTVSFPVLMLCEHLSSVSVCSSHSLPLYTFSIKIST